MDFKKNTLGSGFFYINEANGKPANVPFGYGIVVRFRAAVYGFMLGADIITKKLYANYGTESGFGEWVLIK